MIPWSEGRLIALAWTHWSYHENAFNNLHHFPHPHPFLSLSKVGWGMELLCPGEWCAKMLYEFLFIMCNYSLYKKYCAL